MVIQGKKDLHRDVFQFSTLNVKDLDDVIRKEIAMQIADKMADYLQIYKRKEAYDTVVYECKIDFRNI